MTGRGWIFRLLFSPIFFVSGLAHVGWPERLVERLRESRLGQLISFVDPTLLLRVTGVPLLVGGLLLLAGRHVRAAAAMLLAVLVPITLVHLGKSEPGPLLKNLALMGTLTLFLERERAPATPTPPTGDPP